MNREELRRAQAEMRLSNAGLAAALEITPGALDGLFQKSKITKSLARKAEQLRQDWGTAKAIVETIHGPTIVQRLKSTGGVQKEITLTLYDSQKTLEIFKPGEPDLTINLHRQLNRQMILWLWSALPDVQVYYRKMSMASFREWLHDNKLLNLRGGGLETASSDLDFLNTPDNRAEFAASAGLVRSFGLILGPATPESPPGAKGLPTSDGIIGWAVLQHRCETDDRTIPDRAEVGESHDGFEEL